MRVITILALTIPAALGVAACGSTPPTQVILAPSGPSSSIPMTAPTAPPAPLSEVVPPAPAISTPQIWQPGHWSYTGVGNNPWSWDKGRYVAVPSGASTWVSGQWTKEGSGWIWHDGHWS